MTLPVAGDPCLKTGTDRAALTERIEAEKVVSCRDMIHAKLTESLGRPTSSSNLLGPSSMGSVPNEVVISAASEMSMSKVGELLTHVNLLCLC